MCKRLGIASAGILVCGNALAADIDDASEVILEQGVLGMTFLVMALGLGGMVLVFNYRNHYRGKLSLLRYALSNRVVQLLLACVAVVLAVNIAFSGRVEGGVYEELEFARSHKMNRKAVKLYLDLLEKFPYSPEYHHGYISAFYAADDWYIPEWDAAENDPNLIHPLLYYNRLIYHGPARQKQIGLLGKGMTLYHEERFGPAEDFLKKVKGDAMPFRDLYLGRISKVQGLPLLAEFYFKMEIAHQGEVRLATQDLSKLVLRHHGNNLEKLRSVVEDPVMGRYVPPELGRNLYVRQGDLMAYGKVVFESLASNVNWVGFLASLAGLLFWASFLRRVDEKRKYHPITMATVIGVGSLFCFLALPAYDYLEYVWGFRQTGFFWKDLLFSWLGIGLIEELVKFIPLILLWRSTRLVRTPLDFIVYASLVGLGFAFVENFLVYFTQGSETIIHTRLLITILLHMFNSSIVAYAIVLAKFRYKRRLLPITILGFLIATLFHGLFDFFLMNQWAGVLVFMGFLLFLYASFQYGALLNNALNNDPEFNPRKIGDPHRLAMFVLTGLMGLLLFEFIAVGYLYGASFATRELFQNLAFGSFMIFFLVFNLSNIDVVKGEWFWLRPWNFSTHRNYNLPLGKKLRLRPTDVNNLLSGMLPATGEIVARVRVKGDSRYYVFKFDKTVHLLGHPILHLLVRAQNPDDVLAAGYKMPVSLIAFRNEEALKGPHQDMRDFKLLDKAIVE